MKPQISDMATQALREIVRLRLATEEGSLAKRADRMWEIARETLGDPVAETKRFFENKVVFAPLLLPRTIAPAIEDAIGQMCYTTGPLAQLWRDTGDDIPLAHEHERILFWFLALAIEHGEQWHGVAGEEIARRVEMAKGKAA